MTIAGIQFTYRRQVYTQKAGYQQYNLMTNDDLQMTS